VPEDFNYDWVGGQAQDDPGFAKATPDKQFSCSIFIIHLSFSSMIGFLSGTVARMDAKEVLIQTSGGVGYSVHPAGSLLAECKVGESVNAEIFTVVREQEISLYGFGDKLEKELFVKVTGVSGIGPKIGLQIVSMSPARFTAAVEAGDVASLTEIPGLGKKTAERLILELSGKLDLSHLDEAHAASPALEEAISALEGLGYDRKTIQQRIEQIGQSDSAEVMIKDFLKSNA